MARPPEFLAGLDDRAAAEVLALARPVRLEAGATLFSLGGEATSLYVVERGLVKLTMPMQVAGREENVLIEERVAGQTLGWSTLVPPHRFTTTASVPVDTELLAFPRDALVRHFGRRPDVGYVVSRNVAAIVGQRLQVFQAMWLREMQHIVNQTHA
jgi:CRP/FNR family cyclic AMP-dependent transcriptional regulator